MSKEQSLSVVQNNKFNRVINFFKQKFFGNRIYRQKIYDNIAILEQELININSEDIHHPVVNLSKKTIENRIAVLKYRATLKNKKKKVKSKKIIVE